MAEPSARGTVIRRLGADDLSSMRAMNALFGRAFEEPGTYGDASPDDSYLRAWLGKEHVVALAAFREGEVVGGLVAYEFEKFEQARSEFYIYDLAVEEAHRRQGIATALIEALKPIAAARRAHVIFVQADHVDPPAIALYDKVGRREEVLHFDIAVRG